MRDNKKIFRQRLKETRLMKGWNQAELQRRAGLGSSHVYQLESGSCTPSLDTICTLAATLQVSVGYLVGMEDCDAFFGLKLLMSKVSKLNKEQFAALAQLLDGLLNGDILVP
jgi:transcriptional regulator with XRE-family HTH domain